MSLADLASKQLLPKQSGNNYDLIQAGKFDDLFQYNLEHPLRSKPIYGKLFLKDHLNLTGMQVSLNKLPAKTEVPFYHKHKENEELYIFVGGKGQIQIDGDSIDVKEGTCVRISPAGERTWRNNSDSDLFYIVIQAKDGSLGADTFDDGIPGERPVSW